MMRVFPFLVALICFISAPIAQAQTATPIPPRPRPTPVQTIAIGEFRLEVFFTAIKQGRAGLLYLDGEGIDHARITFRDKEMPFFRADDSGFYAFLAVDMNVPARDTHEYTLTIAQGENRPEVIATLPLVVSLGGFVRQEFNLAADRTYLMDTEIERLEFAKLDGIVTAYTEEKLWGDAGFQYPLNADITSPFGAFRVLNGTFETRHNGWDLRAAVGTPIVAMGDGVVAFAGLMDIRGNCVIINHGYGVFSVYAHFSQVHVTTGQSVQKGQIIGVSGNTGRSNGPHLHWEVVIHQTWIDSVDFMTMWIP